MSDENDEDLIFLRRPANSQYFFTQRYDSQRLSAILTYISWYLGNGKMGVWKIYKPEIRKPESGSAIGTRTGNRMATVSKWETLQPVQR